MQEAYDALGRVLGTTDQVRSTWYCPLCDRGHPNRGSNPTERARHYLDTFGALYGLHASSGGAHPPSYHEDFRGRSDGGLR